MSPNVFFYLLRSSCSTLHCIGLSYNELLKYLACTVFGVKYEVRDFDAVISVGGELQMNKDVIEAILNMLSEKNVFALVMMRDMKEDRIPSLKCLIDYLEGVGGYENSPFAETSVPCRIWCFDVDDGVMKNLEDIDTWARKASVSKIDEHEGVERSHYLSGPRA